MTATTVAPAARARCRTLEHEELVARIERRDRLVGEEDRRVGRERARERAPGPARRRTESRGGPILEALQADGRARAAATASRPRADRRVRAAPMRQAAERHDVCTGSGQATVPPCGR